MNMTKDNDLYARHCMNRLCTGPEWWGFCAPTTEGKDCPVCGYPCEVEAAPDNLDAAAICSGALVTLIG